MIFLIALSVMVTSFFTTDMAYADGEATEGAAVEQAEITEDAAGETESEAPADDQAEPGQAQEEQVSNEGTDNLGSEDPAAEGGQGENIPEQPADPAEGNDQQTDGTGEEQPADPTGEETSDGESSDEGSSNDGTSDDTQTPGTEDGEEAGEGETDVETPEEPAVTLELRSDGRFYENGVLLKSCWVEHEGNRYFVNAAGYPYRDMMITFGKQAYYMGSDGAMQTGKVTASNGQYYYAGEDGLILRSQWITENGVNTYFAGSDGVLYRNQFISFGSKRYFMTADGSVARGAFKASDGNNYYADPDTGLVRSGSGWVTDNDGKMYFSKADGTLYRDMFVSFGKISYYMTSDGSVAKGSFRTADNRQFFADTETGVVNTASGWMTDGDLRYFAKAGGELYREQLVSFGKIAYYMGSDGSIQSDKVVSYGGKYYYAGEDGLIVRSQWVAMHGVNTYFAGADGSFFRNQFISFGSKRYYMTADGSVARGAFKASDGKRYYADPSSCLIRSSAGWITEIEGRRYYSRADGSLYFDQFISFGKIKYYMASDGRLTYGSFRASDGKQYYADIETGIVNTSSGWVTDGYSRYFAKAGGELYRDQFISFGKIRYYMTSNGSMARGSFTASDGKQYYADPETGIVRTSSGWFTDIDGKRYFYKKDGTLYRNQIISFGKIMYYMGSDGSVQIGPVRTPDGKMYMAGADGIIVTKAGWQEYDGKKYYAKDGGELYRKQFISFGKTYYYLGADGSMQTGEQIICGKKYTFREDGTLIGVPHGTTKGIDVSEFQGDIDWAAVKGSGIDFAFIRAGGRGGTSGNIFADEKFTENIQGAISNGIQTGVYFFTQAVSAEEAIEEANFVCDMIKDYAVTLPVVIDTEALYADGISCRHNNISTELRTIVIKAFCDQVIARGYAPMIYGSTTWLEDSLDMSQLPYDVWVAQYYKECEYEGDYSFWQYSENGIVNGIDGYVDMNEWCN